MDDAAARKMLTDHISNPKNSAISCVSAALAYMRRFGRDDEQKIAVEADRFIIAEIKRMAALRGGK